MHTSLHRLRHCFAALVLMGVSMAQAAPDAAPIAVKVMVINMFSLEAAPWLKALAPSKEVRVVGLSADYPTVHCTAEGVCQMTTGMGHANAAASVMALLLSRQFDLRQTYFLIAGIAGIDPARATIGSAAWAHYVVDSGITHEIDAREKPKDWQDGFFGVLTNAPGEKPRPDYRTEEFELNAALMRQALALSAGVKLEDADDVRGYRAHYPSSPANAVPQVLQCDTASGDTWWTGNRIGDFVRRWTKLLTDGKGVYCTTQQEDNATLNALTRGAQAGLADLKRVAVLRTGSDFDRPYPGQAPLQSMLGQRELAGAIRISTDNLVVAGKPLVDAIVTHWTQWQAGVPAL